VTGWLVHTDHYIQTVNVGLWVKSVEVRAMEDDIASDGCVQQCVLVCDVTHDH
jgi:hypothetical protein